MESSKKKESVQLVYPCVACEETYNTETEVRAHMSNDHGQYVPPRQQDIIPPPDNRYDFQQGENGKFYLERYACSSCWFHCDIYSIEVLRAHVLGHHSYKVEIGEQSHGIGEEAKRENYGKDTISREEDNSHVEEDNSQVEEDNSQVEEDNSQVEEDNSQVEEDNNQEEEEEMQDEEDELSYSTEESARGEEYSAQDQEAERSEMYPVILAELDEVAQFLRRSMMMS